MAIMEKQFSEARAPRDTLQSEAGVGTSKVNICPVCSKPYGEHTEADLRSCVGPWPKRERGGSGLELQCEFFEAHFKNEEPDPIKRAKLQAQTLQVLCSCGKAVGDHTVDEIDACFHRGGQQNESTC
jgi:hypothetical protein